MGGGSSETDSGVMWTSEGWSGVPAVEADRRSTCSGAKRGLSPIMGSPSDRSIDSLAAEGEAFLEKRRRNVLLALLVDLLTRLAMIEFCPQGASVK